MGSTERIVQHPVCYFRKGPCSSWAQDRYFISETPKFYNEFYVCDTLWGDFFSLMNQETLLFVHECLRF